MAKAISSLVSGIMSGKVTPDSASAEQTTDASDASRDDDPDFEANPESGESFEGSDLDNADELDLQADGDGQEDDEADLHEQEEVDAEDESGESEQEDEEQSEKPAELEEVDITDDLGRRKIRVDFSDREKLKKYIQQAAGARKLLRVEMPRLKQEAEAARAEVAGYKEDAEIGKSLSKAWEKDGIRGLVAELTKGKQTWDQVFDAEKAHRETLAKMSPAEKRAWELEQTVARKEAEKTDAEKRLEAKLKELDDRETATERATLQGYMELPFEKHRFAGKLGDEAREHRLDKMLWNAVRNEIAELADDTPVTSQLVSRLFREQAAAVQATIKTEARKQTKKVLTQKKDEAKHAAQARMRSAESSPSGAANKKLRDSMRSGDFVGGIVDFLSGGKQKKAK